MSKTETRSATSASAQSRLFPTRTQSLRFPPLERGNHPTTIPPSRLTLASVPESRLTISRITLSRLTTVSNSNKRSVSHLRRSETASHKSPDDRLVFQSLSKKDHDKLQPIANAYSLPVPKIKLLILNGRSSDNHNHNKRSTSSSNNQEYTNDFEPISRENTIVNDLKVVGNRIEPLKSAKMRSTLSRSESFKNSDYSDYTSYRPKTSVLMNRNPLTIDE